MVNCPLGTSAGILSTCYRLTHLGTALLNSVVVSFPAVVVSFLADDLAVPIEMHLDFTAILTADLDFVGGAIVADFSLRDPATRVFCQSSSNAVVAGLATDRPVVMCSLSGPDQGSFGSSGTG